MQRGDLPQAIGYEPRTPGYNQCGAANRQPGQCAFTRADAKRLAPGGVTITTQQAPVLIPHICRRAPAGGGMPYAAVRRPAAMLPFTVLLDDLVSMSERQYYLLLRNLVMVRLSRSGTAQLRQMIGYGVPGLINKII